ncbi:MAG: alpha/beta hydrolase [Emcibacter sp.]|nr:alpha/beta hydrolase [Emcibacter sp.]
MKWDIPEEPLNLDIPTLGGKFLWADIHLLAGWRIQRNILSNHYRLLDDKNKRRAWGNQGHCQKKLDEFKVGLNLSFPKSHIFLLLHGLGRHSNSMKKPEKFLRQHDFAAYALNYPSTFQSVEQHADGLELLLNNLDGVTSVSFIGHSLGGLVAWELLSRKEGWRKRTTARHLIMMGTPNNGARISDIMSSLKLFRAIAGPSAQDLLPYRRQNLTSPDIPTCIITGGRGTKAGFNPLLGEDNDGIVTVNETKVDGMTSFTLINNIHTTLMNHPKSLQALLDFIK